MAYSLLNTANCGGTNNIGFKGCNNEPDFLKYIVFVPKGTTIPAASLLTQAAFNTYVDAALESDTRADRWFITPLLGEFKNNTEAPKIKDMDGLKLLSQMMPYNWEWRLAPGNKCIHKKLKTFHQQQSNYDCFVIDANGLWMGWEDPSDTGKMKAYTVDSIIIADWDPKVSGETNKYSIMLAFGDNKQFNDYWANFASTRSAGTLVGLTDVSLSQGVDTAGTAIVNTTSYIYVRANVACGGTNMGDLFGDTLDDTTAWLVTNSSGGSVSLTGVTYNTTTKNFRLASSTAFTSAATFNVKMAAPSVLTGLDADATVITENAWQVTIP